MADQSVPPAENRFAASWLALREPRDSISRSADLAEAFCRAVSESGESTTRLIDLGTGRGANPAYLLPRLPGSTTWVLVDHDPALLAEAEARLSTADVERRPADLLTDLDSIDFRASDGVTASAFLDLVSSDWLQRFVARCAAAAIPVLLPLTYDGTMTWRPAAPFDSVVLSAINRHQRTDKGFGPALGPAAAAEAARLFEASGFTVDARPSPWRLSPDDTDMLDALIEGIAEACQDVIPLERAETESWRRNRQHQRLERTLELVVGHVDILALPPEF